MKKTFVIILLLFLQQACGIKDNNTLKLPTNYAKQEQKLKFVFHFDLDGCFLCSASIGGVDRFISLMQEQFCTNFDVLIILHATNEEGEYIKNITRCPYNIFIDPNNSFAIKNGIVYDIHKICYLIDNENKILWKGNPIRNRKDKKEVLNFLSGLLSVELRDIVDSDKIDIGTFNWQSAQNTTFTIHNTSNEPMLIDTIFTSCECTTAEINKHNIAPADSAIVSVCFKAEKPEQFMREVYVGVRGKEQIVLSIEGEAVEI